MLNVHAFVDITITGEVLKYIFIEMICRVLIYCKWGYLFLSICNFLPKFELKLSICM